MSIAGFHLAGWGFGEWFRLEQSHNYNEPSHAIAHDEACDGNSTSVVGTAFAMLGGAQPPRFIGPNSSTPTTYANADSFTSSQIGPGEHVTIMAKQADAICYLVGLGGKFTHDTEAAYLATYGAYDGTTYWYYWALIARAGEGGSVTARANCYAYDQRF
jgi:hypothetical protein